MKQYVGICLFALAMCWNHLRLQLTVHAFVPTISSRPSKCPSNARIFLTSYTPQEIHDMESVVWRLSDNSDDDNRRRELKDLFFESSPRFTSLFEKIVVDVGERVQLQARQESAKSNGPIDQQQLWALVDMMVQCKVLIKQQQSFGKEETPQK